MKITTIVCDICGSEENVNTMSLPAFRTFDSTEGRTFYDEPNIGFITIDICPCCLRKVTNIHDRRVMGFGTICIEQNPAIIKEDKK